GVEVVLEHLFKQRMLPSRFQSRDDNLQQRLVELIGGCIGVTRLHATLPRVLGNSRHLMASPTPRTPSGMRKISHFWIEKLCRPLHPSGPGAMSALGQKRTLLHLRPMSALPPKADIAVGRDSSLKQATQT